MHWKPDGRAAPVALGKSRIRRDPVKLVSDVPSIRRAPRLTREQEMWFGVAGVLLIAAAIVAATVGLAIGTYTKLDPTSAAQEKRFGQCYNATGPNCVLDGDTIYVEGTRVTIAGMEAPQILGAQCDVERSRGIDAAVQLANRLNSGSVTVSAPFRDEYGREVRTVEVKGRNVAETMINAELARGYTGQPQNWCG